MIDDHDAYHENDGWDRYQDEAMLADLDTGDTHPGPDDPALIIEAVLDATEVGLFAGEVDTSTWDTADLLRLHRVVGDGVAIWRRTAADIAARAAGIVDRPVEVDGRIYRPKTSVSRKGWQYDRLASAAVDRLAVDTYTGDGERVRAVPTDDVMAFFKPHTSTRKLRQLNLDADNFSELSETVGIEEVK